MKYLLSITVVGILFSSCGNNQNTQSTNVIESEVIPDSVIDLPKLQRNILGIKLGETGPTKVKKIMQSEGLTIFEEEDLLSGIGTFNFGGYDWDCILCNFKDDVAYDISLSKTVKGNEDYYNANLRELQWLQEKMLEKYPTYAVLQEEHMYTFVDGLTIVSVYGGNLDVEKKEANRWIRYTDDKLLNEKLQDENNEL